MKNAIESFLPEVSINRTNYYAGGRLKFSTLECKEMGKIKGQFKGSTAGPPKRPHKSLPLGL